MRLADPFRRSRETRQRSNRPYRSGCEVTLAIRTNTAEPPLYAIDTEGTFERIDPRVRTLRRQVPVTAFTVRAKDEHDPIVSHAGVGGYDSST